MLNLFLQFVVPTLGSVLLGLLGVLAHRKSVDTKVNTDATAKEQTLQRATHLLSVLLEHAKTTLEPELKRALSDGELDDIEKEHLKQLVLGELKHYLTADGLVELADALGIRAADVESYLLKLITSRLNVDPR